MKKHFISLILDSSFCPVLLKLFQGVKNNYFVLFSEFWAKIPKQLQIKGKKCDFHVSNGHVSNSYLSNAKNLE